MGDTTRADGSPDPIRVSVVVPCRNEIGYIDEFLDAVTRQTPVSGGYEILVADGASDDGTRERLDQRARLDPRIRVLDNPRRIQAAGLNQALRAARGEIVVRMDVHTVYAEDYLAESVSALERTGAANVGGPAQTRASGSFQRANALAYRSFFSVGGARFHDPTYEGYVDTVPYGCWRKSYLMDLGLFDESLARNEDDELNLRIEKRGDKIWQTPRIRSWYSPRASARGLFAQYYQYGYWKVPVIRKHRRAASWRHFVPAAVVVLGPLVLLSAAFSTVGAWMALACASSYCLLSIVASLLACRRAGDFRPLPLLPAVFLIYHLSYGLGFLRGVGDFIVLQRSGARSMSRVTR